jgi:hypothetical protein
MMNPVITEMTKLTDALTPILSNDEVREAIGEEGLEAIGTHLLDLEKELSNPSILGDIKRNIVTSFEDWDERVFDIVEFVRGTESITQINIQSLTAKEMGELRVKIRAAAPEEPVRRDRGDGNADMNDKVYARDMVAYNEAKSRLDDLSVLWYLEKGLKGITIPGKSDDEKLEFVGKKVAGDAAKIASAIMDLSNLTPDTLQPF